MSSPTDEEARINLFPPHRTKTSGGGAAPCCGPTIIADSLTFIYYSTVVTAQACNCFRQERFRTSRPAKP